ncbi:flavodoxin family protein [uncultured Veillonella sp.]|uniref:NAD(P)H-dependent oxidoreductase n=1 Tax=uncultured Veillonella sp. TaxID=159268 RepID=UPI002626B6E1|nr:flavodoxin family protein [uncultured Veillonella sp.]
MNVIAINGSPRPNKNTAQLLNKALEGAKQSGATTELISLYQLHYRGCVSCFYCKRKDKEHGTCIIKDDLSPIIEKLKAADAIIWGSPIYFSNMSAAILALFERFLFSNYIYSESHPSVLGKQIPSTFIYTMNMTEEQSHQFHLRDVVLPVETGVHRILGVEPEKLYAYNTVQFDDYSKFESSIFSESDKKAYKEAHFENELNQAFQLGQDLVAKAQLINK